MTAGSIIVRQRGMTFKAGEGAGLGHDYTIFAKIDGKVRFEHETRDKKRVRIIPVATEPVATSRSRPRPRTGPVPTAATTGGHGPVRTASKEHP